MIASLGEIEHGGAETLVLRIVAVLLEPVADVAEARYGGDLHLLLEPDLGGRDTAVHAVLDPGIPHADRLDDRRGVDAGPRPEGVVAHHRVGVTDRHAAHLGSQAAVLGQAREVAVVHPE